MPVVVGVPAALRSLTCAVHGDVWQGAKAPRGGAVEDICQAHEAQEDEEEEAEKEAQALKASKAMEKQKAKKLKAQSEAEAEQQMLDSKGLDCMRELVAELCKLRKRQERQGKNPPLTPTFTPCHPSTPYNYPDPNPCGGW
jgi:hypothetical protein